MNFNSNYKKKIFKGYLAITIVTFTIVTFWNSIELQGRVNADNYWGYASNIVLSQTYSGDLQTNQRKLHQQCEELLDIPLPCYNILG